MSVNIWTDGRMDRLVEVYNQRVTLWCHRTRNRLTLLVDSSKETSRKHRIYGNYLDLTS